MKSGEMRRAIEYLPTTAFATKTYCEPLLRLHPVGVLCPSQMCQLWAHAVSGLVVQSCAPCWSSWLAGAGLPCRAQRGALCNILVDKGVPAQLLAPLRQVPLQMMGKPRTLTCAEALHLSILRDTPCKCTEQPWHCTLHQG